jgi:hypothetical protein
VRACEEEKSERSRLPRKKCGKPFWLCEEIHPETGGKVSPQRPGPESHTNDDGFLSTISIT